MGFLTPFFNVSLFIPVTSVTIASIRGDRDGSSCKPFTACIISYVLVLRVLLFGYTCMQFPMFICALNAISILSIMALFPLSLIKGVGLRVFCFSFSFLLQWWITPKARRFPKCPSLVLRWRRRKGFWSCSSVWRGSCHDDHVKVFEEWKCY